MGRVPLSIASAVAPVAVVALSVVGGEHAGLRRFCTGPNSSRCALWSVQDADEVDIRSHGPERLEHLMSARARRSTPVLVRRIFRSMDACSRPVRLLNSRCGLALPPLGESLVHGGTCLSAQ